MNRALIIFYAIALAFHAVVLFYLKPPEPKPPKIFNETYVDVTLTKPPEPEPPQPIVIPQPPKPEEKIKPPPPPKPEMTVPEPKPEPTPPPSESKPVVTPPLPTRPKQEYVSVSEPKYAQRVEPIYPGQAKRWHQQGVVVLALYISESGALDRVEVVKSSGFPLLDAAAVRALKDSRFNPAIQGMLPMRSRAEVTVTFRLE